MRKRKRHTLLLIIFTVSSIGGGHLHAETTVMASDPGGISFEYFPRVSSVITEDDTVKIKVHGGDITQIPGEPVVPVRVFTVAVPVGSKPRIELLSRESGTIYTGSLTIFKPDENAIVPRIQKYDDFPNVTVGEFTSGSIAGVPVIRIPIYPLRVSPTERQIDLAKRIAVRVIFNAPENTDFVHPVHVNRLAQLLLLNPDQARFFGKNRTSNLLEPYWPQGFIYRFEIDQEAMYRVNFEDLRSKGVNISPSGIPSGQIRLFGNGGLPLPESTGAEVPVGLVECAILVEDGGDGRFGPGDWLVFYGRGAGGWVFDSDIGWHHESNPYTFKNIYWLNIDPSGGGRRMATIEDPPAIDTVVTSGESHSYLEQDRFIYGRSDFIGAGRRWYSYTFDGPSRLSYSVKLDEPDTDLPAALHVRIVNARTSGSPSPVIRISCNGEFLEEILIQSSSTTIDGVIQIEIDGDLLRDGINFIEFEQIVSNGKALFDWMDLEYSAHLRGFQTFAGIDFNGNVKYQCENLNDPLIFDVSDHNQVKYAPRQEVTISGDNNGRRFFALSTEMLRSVASPFEEYFPPEMDITNTWSHSNQYDILMIMPDVYTDIFEPMMEYYTRRNPPLRSARVPLSEVYNRFSGGLQDPTAIRNFLLYTVYGEWTKSPDYVMFCGDGDYNYRRIDLDRSSAKYFFPPFEDLATARCTDDWFVDFDSDSSARVLPEMIIGRLTGSGPFEMESIINKIIAYAEEPEFGTWRNRVTLVADDEYGETTHREIEHILDQENLSREFIPSHMDIAKIYLTEYERELGREKPKSGDDLVNAINRGTLLVSYMGHGNASLWAHEHVFVQSRDLPRIENSTRQPLFLAFTCDWAYWDNPTSQSFPEQLLSMRNGGAIGTIASTRLTYSSSNRALAENYFGNQFGSADNSIGEALAIAKHHALIPLGSTYHLLGDPSIHLATPQLSGEFSLPDPYPLEPLSLSTIHGQVHDAHGNRYEAFSGSLDFIVKDTEIPRVYIIEVDDSYDISLPYRLPGPLVYRGLFSLNDGEFSGNFVVPVDVTMGSHLGKVYGYFHNNEIDGVLSMDSVAFADRASNAVDSIAPEIEVFFDHRGYRSEDKIGSDPLLIVDVSDASGLNLTGKMGHGISVVIDGSNQIDLTADFSFHQDSHTSGSLSRRIGTLSAGKHDIEVIAWDSFNNFAVKELEIDILDDDDGLILDRVLNWPNPFRESTTLTFVVNRPVEYEVMIFTVGGRRIRDFRGFAADAGMVSDIVWDGRDSAGRSIGNGVFLYKVVVKDLDGGRAEGLGRIAYVR